MQCPILRMINKKLIYLKLNDPQLLEDFYCKMRKDQELLEKVFGPNTAIVLCGLNEENSDEETTNPNKWGNDV